MSKHNKQILQKITRGLRSKYPLFYILGWEEERMERLLSVIAESAFSRPVPLVSWTSSQGFNDAKSTRLTNPVEALQHILQVKTRGIYLMKDLPAEFEHDTTLVRAVRDLYYQLRNRGVFVFFTHPQLKLPDALKKEIFLVEMPLPTEEEILDKINHQLASMDASVRPEARLLHRMAVAMKGLSLDEVGHLLARLPRRRELDMDTAMEEIQDEKSQILRKESCLRFYPPQASMDNVGGLDNLKDWVLKRDDLFTEPGYVPYGSGVKALSPRETCVKRGTRSAFDLDGGAGGRRVMEPTGFLRDYWLGRYHGMIEAPGTREESLIRVTPAGKAQPGAKPYDGPARPKLY